MGTDCTRKQLCDHVSLFAWHRAACLIGMSFVLAGCGQTIETPTASLQAAPVALTVQPTGIPLPRLGPVRPKVMAAAASIADPVKRLIRRGGGYAKLGKRYQIGDRWYQPKRDPQYDQTGVASWYGTAFHGKMTANGEYFDMDRLSAAHPTLPLPSYVSVTNLSNGRTLVVRVNDRGPYAHNRLIDLSRQTARYLGFEHQGTAKVRVRYVGPAPLDGNDQHEQTYLKRQPWFKTVVASR